MDDCKKECPLCGNECKIMGDPIGCNHDTILCEYCYHFQIFFENEDKKEMRKRYNMIYEFLLNTPCKKGDCYKFYCRQPNEPIKDDPMFIDVSELMKNYPKSIGEKLDRIILNISKKFPNIGEPFTFEDLPNSLMFIEAYDKKENEIFNEKVTFKEYLKDINLISNYTEQKEKLTAKSWERIAELTRKQKEINQGFIAMQFGNETQDISDNFEKAIKDCGYIAKRIDKKEYNSQIVPEIFYEIEQSKFVVVDVTYQNYGAYYEAGYAQALGKQVIICCKKSEFDDENKKPHFDIVQQNMIIWIDENELIERLKRRIEVTVGLNV
jgi:nucleoside 2-deoxyribosyltransferase